MIIAVIGDYDSPSYKVLLQVVGISFPDEKIMDLSAVSNSRDYRTRQAERFAEIETSHMFVFDSKWEDSAEIRQDITHAQKAGKDGYLYSAGKFTSYPCHG